MFEQNLKSEDDERKVVLTKSEEELSSPDRRSLVQKKLADRFVNSITNRVVTEEDTIKSNSESSEDENEERKEDIQIDKRIFESNGSEMSAHAAVAENFEFSIDDDDNELNDEEKDVDSTEVNAEPEK